MNMVLFIIINMVCLFFIILMAYYSLTLVEEFLFAEYRIKRWTDVGDLLLQLLVLFSFTFVLIHTWKEFLEL